MTLYFKIFNEQEKHYNYQYKEGLNILKDKFNDNVDDSCCEG